MLTPNYATIKFTRPWQKAINYKGQRIVKDLFKTGEKRGDCKQRARKKESLRVSENKKRKNINKNDSIKLLKK